MSASTPGRYRSRLFNFINHHSRRLIDRGERAIRHLQMAAVWGTQILLYPIYLVVQGSLTAFRQLSAQAKAGWTRFNTLTQSQPLDTPLAVDTPIQQVLEQVETFVLPEPCQWQRLPPVSDEERQIIGLGLTDQGIETTNPLTKLPRLGNQEVQQTVALQDQLHSTGIDSHSITDTLSADPSVCTSLRVKIQGVATLLATRTLVLVSVANEILDILTPEQQQKLAARISWELATFYRQWRLVAHDQASGVQRQLSHLAKPSLFLPLRRFWQLMAWVQTSPVAIVINLFDESTLVPVRDSALSAQPESTEAIASGIQISPKFAYSWLERLTPGGTLAAIDDTIAQWESQPLQTSNQVAIALRQRSQTLLQTFKTSFITPRQPTELTETSTPHPFWLLGLIYAAIDYFFGDRRSHRFHHQEVTSVNPTETIRHRFANSTASVMLPETAFTDTGEPDPWLTWDDLFGHSPATPTPNLVVTHSPWLKGKPQAIPTPLPEGFTVKKTVFWKNALGVILRGLGFPKTRGMLTVTNREQPKAQPSQSQIQTVNPTCSFFLLFPGFGKPLSCQERDFEFSPFSAKKAEHPLPSPVKKVPFPNSWITELGNTTKNKAFVKIVSSTFLEPTSTSFPHPLQSGSSFQLSVPWSSDSVLSVVCPDAEVCFLSTNIPQQPILHSPTPDIQPAPDWIEAQAIPTGYVKHPLEQILEWLDKGIFWLEEVTIKAWRWVRRLVGKN